MGGMCSSEEEYPLMDAIKGVKAGDLLLADCLEHLNEGTVNKELEGGWTPLHVACAFRAHDYHDSKEPEQIQTLKDMIGLVKELIAKGANVNAQTRAGGTPLHEASFNDFEEAAEMLLEKGATVDLQNAGGRSPLHLACQRGALQIATMLVEKGADGDLEDRDKATPFAEASDSCKKLLHAHDFSGDMSTTNESRDAAFVEALADRGTIDAAAEQAIGPQGALKKDHQAEKSGMLSIQIEKSEEGISIVVERAKYLKDCDTLGDNDVYVVVSIGIAEETMQHQRTSVVKNGGADPVWNNGDGERLTFLDVPDEFEDIHFYCYDEDMGGEMNHDLIGTHFMGHIAVERVKERFKEHPQIFSGDIQLRENKEEAQSLPPVTSDRYRPPDDTENPLAGGIAAT